MTIHGIVPALVTPMHEDESLHLAELARQVERQIAAGAAAVFCLGTNGEFFALSAEEKRAVIETTVQAAKGRVPVIAGTGCVTTRDTVHLTRLAKEVGADMATVITPYFAGISQAGILHHFTAVADEGGLPVILYNIPARTGVNVAHQTVRALSEHPMIVGIKDSSGNFDNTLRYIEETPDDFMVLCGNDSLILWTLLAGGNGGISGIANLFPERMVSIYALYAEGKLKEARKAQDSVRAIRDMLKLDNPNSVVKYAANLLGQPVGPVRSPFGLAEDTREAVAKALLCYA